MKLDLSQAQLRRLKNGHAVQIRASQIGSGVDLSLHPSVEKRLESARRRNKGMRFQMSKDEVEASGIRETLQKVGKFYKEHVKPIAAPILREGARRGLKIAKEAVNTATMGALEPEINSLYERYGDKLIDVVGKVSGAYGMRAGKIYVGPNYSPILDDMNPAKSVASSQLQPPGEAPKKRSRGGKMCNCSNCGCGGSFRTI